MQILGEQIPFQGLAANDNLTAAAGVLSANVTPAQFPATSSGLPLSAVISGVMISVVLIAVLIYTAVCSHRSSRRRLFSTPHHHQHTLGMDRILHEDYHAYTLDYCSVNNAFIETFDNCNTLHVEAHTRDKTFSKTRSCNNAFIGTPDLNCNTLRVEAHTRDKTVSKIRSDLNQLSEEKMTNDEDWIQGKYSEWYRAAYDEDSDQSDSQSEDEVMSEVRRPRTWRLGSVELMEIISEENEDVLTPVNVTMNTSRCHSIQAESDGKLESEEESELQFHSCSEGDDFSTAGDTREDKQNTVFDSQTGYQYSVSPVQNQEERELPETNPLQWEEIK